MEFGTRDGLLLRVRWGGNLRAARTADRTRGTLELRIAGRTVWAERGWPRVRGFTWTWIDLVEFLADAWPFLLWEEVPPGQLRLSSPRWLRADAERRWNAVPGEVRSKEEHEFFEFEERHDLARGLQGAVVPSVFLLRQGQKMWVSGPNSEARCPVREVLDTLTAFGDAVLERLDGTADERARIIRERWRTRDQVPADSALAIATSLPSDRLRVLSGNSDLTSFWEIPQEGFEPSEVMAAARMLCNQPSEVIGAVLEEVRGIPRGDSAAVDAASDALVERLRVPTSARAWEEGYSTARVVREGLLRVGDHERVDPEEVLRSWGVEVRGIELATDQVDAIACWGPRHGPAVVVNSKGKHSSSRRGARASLAHEMCHFLLDRNDALPLSEVMGGRTPERPEQRANAFAAELLIPREVAGREMATASLEPQETLERLCGRFGASEEVVAWQAHNSTYQLPDPVFDLLRSKVSDPTAF